MEFSSYVRLMDGNQARHDTPRVIFKNSSDVINISQSLKGYGMAKSFGP
jgi:hypothetical protein